MGLMISRSVGRTRQKLGGSHCNRQSLARASLRCWICYIPSSSTGTDFSSSEEGSGEGERDARHKMLDKANEAREQTRKEAEEVKKKAEKVVKE